MREASRLTHQYQEEVDEMIQQMLYLFYNVLSFSPASKHSLQPGFLLHVLILRERELIVKAGGIQNSQCSGFCNFQCLQVEDYFW